MYEQVSRGIQLICCLAASLKFISFATFVVAVDGVGFNFNRHFSSSVYVVVDTKLFDPFLSMCDQPLVCCDHRISWSRFSILIVIFHLQSTLLSIISFTMETISLQSCGYYCSSCGYGIALWIVDIILFQAERLQKCKLKVTIKHRNSGSK